MSEWKKVKLGEISDSCLGKMLDAVKNRGEYQPYLANLNVRWGSFDLDNLSMMKFEEHEEDRYGIKYGDLIICEGGEPGRCAVWKEQMPNMKIQKALHRVRGKKCIVDNFYLFYWFLYAGKRGYIDQYCTGATIKHLPGQKLKEVEVDLPTLATQHRIATILSRYDSLVENYQKQIKLLEEAAQRLYKEWFIDLHFPGHGNTNIIDGVPEGWEKKKLCEFTGITDGTHDSPKQVEIGFPLVTGRCIVDGSIDFSQAYNISEEDVIKINKRSAVEDGDILLSNIGTIGKVCRISKSGNYAVKNMIIFKPHDAIHSCFLHRFLTDNNTQMDFLQQAAGTSQKFVSLSFIRNTLILRPSDTILNLFYNHSEKYFNYVQSLQSQLRLLTEARDRLLPKLMSGEIEV